MAATEFCTVLTNAFWLLASGGLCDHANSVSKDPGVRAGVRGGESRPTRAAAQGQVSAPV